jgi:hypothetical protein
LLVNLLCVEGMSEFCGCCGKFMSSGADPLKSHRRLRILGLDVDPYIVGTVWERGGLAQGGWGHKGGRKATLEIDYNTYKNNS